MTEEHLFFSKIIIIGAGPAGLALAGRLTQLGISYLILEKEKAVAPMWMKHYDRLHLHTVGKLSHLPFLDFPKDFPTYVSKNQLLEYYRNYADKFQIRPLFGKEISKIHRKGNRWELMTVDNERWESDMVVIATGVNREPVIPIWSGQRDFAGIFMHSRFYKNPGPFLGKKVLVVGMGNTGAEIALDLAENGIVTYLSVRSPVNIVPRDVLGRPAQLTARMLEKFPFGLGKIISRISTRLVIGDLTKYGIQKPVMDPVDQLKTTGQTPVIDLGTVAKIKEGKIKIVPDIDHFTGRGVQLKDGRFLETEAVILATGYRAGLENILDDTGPLLDKYGLPKSWKGDGSYEGLYFLGFDNYKLGGILGTIYNDSEKICRDIVGKLQQGTN